VTVDLVLIALVHAYVGGDRGARLALVDWLEEHADPRADTVRAAALDWNAVAREIYRGRNPCSGDGHRGGTSVYYEPELNRYRWLIDCALVGADVPPDVVETVRAAHRRWLTGLFPELR
jgi:uncharacterized protein (TIGR02996 family)